MPSTVDTLAFAHTLADEAGRIVCQYFRQPSDIQHKVDASPVTRADREAETAMRTLIEEIFPRDGIVGEEHGNLRPSAECQWVLDPIDGTRPFISGFPTFTTLIARTSAGVPTLGIIDQPILKERWVGNAGSPTTLNGKTVIPRSTQQLSSALISTTSTHYFTPKETSAFEKLRHQCAYTQLGGDAYGYAMLASGQIDIVVDAGMKPYDFCALIPVLEGAGAVITDWKGKKLTLSSKGDILACATPSLHKQALSALQAAA